jgi:hypothetical protein
VPVDEEDAVADSLEHACRLRTLLHLAIELRVLDRGSGTTGELLGECEVVGAVASPRLRRDK